jgi:hypothetical protein
VSIEEQYARIKEDMGLLFYLAIINLRGYPELFWGFYREAEDV